MWILPKQLHTSAFVPDTAALISDLAEQSQICEQSLLARSKPSLARTWSQKWKRDSWTQLLSGRILKPFHGPSFVTAWTSSLEVIPASHSQQQGSDSEETTLDTSGLGSQMELELCDPESASSKTSRDTSTLDSEKSSANWKALVTKRRGEYSLRVKSAHLTNASECSSWASITANDWKGSTPNSITRKDGKSRIDQLAYQTEQHNLFYPTPCAMEAEKAGFHAKGQMGQSLSAMANRGELQWLTPATVQIQRADMQKRIDYRASIGRKYVPGSLKEQMQQHGQAVPVSPSMSGSRQESWATPSCMDTLPARSAEALARAKLKGGCKNLREEVHQWATPNTMDHLDCRSAEGVIKIATGARKGRSMPSNLREQVDPQTVDIYQKTKEESWATPRAGATDNSRPNNKGGIPLGDQARRAEPTMNSSKLNPRWVETLMGLPIGWTMPSCSSPLTIAPMNCDCLETELSQPPQPELF